jgi:hypothetical protein
VSLVDIVGFMDDQSQNKSLEEARKQNIARNNDFMKSLFGPLGFGSPKASQVEGPESDLEVTLSSIKAKKRKHEEDCEIAVSLVKDSNPHRHGEIDELYGYLNEVSVF